MKQIFLPRLCLLLAAGLLVPPLRAAPPNKGTAADAPKAGGYEITTLDTPADLEVGGMDWTADGRMMVCTRKGQVWSMKDGKWTLFASGLQEALGLLCDPKGQVYVMQRPELTRLVDTDGDGVADRYETVCDAFGFTGNYHEFAYGPVRDKEGNFYCSLNLSHSPDQWGGAFMGIAPKANLRGWAVKITPEGKLIPWAVGLRSPNGIATSPDGEIFLTDNQGEFVAASWMHHLKKGAFYGHPSSLTFDKERNVSPKTTSIEALDKMRTPPCVVFPYGRMGQSISQPVWDTTAGKFGPFAGQVFVGDVQIPLVMRATLEQVNGEYQGASYPFLRDDKLQGANRLLFAPDGTMYCGVTDRGWVKQSAGIAKITFRGQTPLEIQQMSLTEKGFDVSFTKPIDAATAGSESVYQLTHWRHEYHKAYGSPELDKTAAKIAEVKISPDGKTVSLVIPDLVPKTVYELHIQGVRGAGGEEMRNNTAYYTLNQLRK